MKQIVLVIALWSLAVFAQAQTVEYTAAADTNRIRIGEQFNFTVHIKYEGEKPIQWSDESDTIGKFEIVDGPFVDSTQVNGLKEYKLRYVLTAWDTGYFILFPKPLVVGTDTLNTEPVFMEVHFVDAIPEEPHDIKNRWSEPWRWWEIASLIVLVLVLAAFIYGIVKRLKNRKPKVETVVATLPKIDPLEWVRNEVAALKREKLYLHGLEKEYFTRLANLPRTYAEMTMNVAALEMTSSEFLEAIKLKPEVSSADIKSLREILSLADMVKFAMGKSDPESCEKDLEQLSVIIEQWHQKQTPKQEK